MNRNLSLLLGLLALQIYSQDLHAQSRSDKEDVLYLKNGWTLRGTVSTSAGDSISIITSDRNRYIFAGSDVDHISHEKKKWGESHYRNYGFGHFTEVGALAATKNRPDNVTTAAFSFQAVNGFRFNERLFTGVGIAADLYATQTTIPLFASIRGDLLTRGLFVPYYFVDGGY
jgi:hypothetical protein